MALLAVNHTSLVAVPETCGAEKIPPFTTSSTAQQPADQRRTRRTVEFGPPAGDGSEPTKKKSSTPADQASVTVKPDGTPDSPVISVQVAPGCGGVGQFVMG